MHIYSFSPFGYEGSLVPVEVDLRRGIPTVDIVGLADGTVKKSRERMQAAIRNTGRFLSLNRNSRTGMDLPPSKVENLQEKRWNAPPVPKLFFRSRWELEAFAERLF